MKIVIDIKDYDREWIANGYHIPDEINGKIAEAIIDGTPLPKGHGDLKDIGECDRKLFYQQCGGSDSLITVKSAFDMLLALPSVLKSDKESEDKK